MENQLPYMLDQIAADHEFVRLLDAASDGARADKYLISRILRPIDNAMRKLFELKPESWPPAQLRALQVCIAKWEGYRGLPLYGPRKELTELYVRTRSLSSDQEAAIILLAFQALSPDFFVTLKTRLKRNTLLKRKLSLGLGGTPTVAAAKSSLRTVPDAATVNRVAPKLIVSLFTGIGGFDLGFHRHGNQMRLMCEKDPAARAVLRVRFPGTEIVEDVANLREIPTGTDLLTMGFPCQDLSQVGTRTGISGRSTGIVWTALKLIRRRPPLALLIENVPFMLRLARGEAIRRLTDELRQIGYRWAYRVVDVRAFGLPQRRPRVFVYATLEGDPRAALLSEDSGIPQNVDRANGHRPAVGFYWTEGNRGLGTALDSIPPLKGGSTLGIPSSPAILMPDGHVVTLDIRDAERLQGFPAGWTSPAQTVARPGARWRLVGNAVNVRVAAWLARRIRHPKPYISTNDQPLVPGAPWPNAAYQLDGTPYVANAGPHPVQRSTVDIVTFLRCDSPLLSAKATRGILGRLRNSSLRTPEGFLEALEAHIVEVELPRPLNRRNVNLKSR
jgi:DNA (cytosine-5)-methyltransferase 1